MEVKLLYADPQLACACRVTLLRTVLLQHVQGSGFSLLFMLLRHNACLPDRSDCCLLVGQATWECQKRQGVQKQPAVRVTPHGQAIPLYNRQARLPKDFQHLHTIAVPPITKHSS